MQQYLNDLESRDSSLCLKALELIDSYLAGQTQLLEEDATRLLHHLGHRIWLIRSRLYDLCLKHQDKLYPFVAECLASPNPDIQYWSIQLYCSVARQQHEQALLCTDTEKQMRHLNFVDRNIKRLITVYPEATPQNQLIILLGLAKTSYQKLIPFFAEQMGSSRWVIRNESAKAMVELGAHAVPALKKLIIEGNKDQCYWAFSALGQILKDKALDPFFKVVSSQEYAEEIRIYALAGIKKIGSAASIPYLLRCLNSDLWVVRAQASEALIAYGSRTTDELILCFTAEDQNVRYWALKTLAEVVTEQDLGSLESYLNSSDQELRFYIVSAIARIPSPRAVTLIAGRFEDDAWLIRKHAADTLIQLGENAIQPLVQILKTELGNEEKVFWTLNVLSALKVKTVLPAFEKLLSSDSKDYRLYAVRAIANVMGEERFKPLIGGFLNDLWVVRHQCYLELKKLMQPRLAVLLFSYLNHPDDSMQYWVSRLLSESEKPGIMALSEALVAESHAICIEISRKLENLQEIWLEKFFDHSLASVKLLEEWNQDPFKIRDVAQNVQVTPVVDSRPQLPITQIQDTSPNYFHFELKEAENYSLNLFQILEKAVLFGASDLHLKVNRPPMVRVNGIIQPLELPILSANTIKDLLRNTFDFWQQKQFCQKKQLDASLVLPSKERFRVNLFLTHHGIEGVFRHIRRTIPTFSDLHLPPEIFERISLMDSGLVLVTGVTGSGKSSTLASIVGAINQRDSKHIITIEDPIEYVHSSQKSVISHRQIGEHVDSFVDGLKACLREDPDVVLVGEMRDVETIKATLKLAGTGHLVFSTFHTASAPQTIEQIIQYFPPEERQNICAQLGFCLNAVISQILVEDSKSLGRIPVLEIMFATQAVKNMIRDSKTEQLVSVLQTSSSEGMITRDQYLKNLYQKRKISPEIYEYYTLDKKQMSP